MSDPNESKKESVKAGHTLADHSLGIDLAHTHDGYADHDHDFPDELPLEENPIWIADHVSLMTVGIDIGSSGTQVIFSRVNLRRLGEELTSRYYVVSRETLFQSPVALTPYASEERIDERKLGEIIDEAYGAARVAPSEIDTGVVILTGEALRRENAQAIAGIIAEKGGDFVCATAGHHMESMLAAYGSGAARVSSDEGKRILNIDIGGGTTKLAVVENGKVVATAAVHVGGRLQVVDAAGAIIRLDPAGRHHARRAGFSWNRGDRVTDADMDEVAGAMADALVAAVVAERAPHDVEHLYLTDRIADLGHIDGVMFSGGVAEYVYGRETRDFGDMGRRLGRALRARVDRGDLPWPLLSAGECIRATALGASEYSVQLSGNTSYISTPGVLLPRRNLQVLQPPYVCAETIDPDAVAQAIRSHIVAFDVEDEREIALAFRWQGAPAYERLAAFAEGIRRGLAPRIARRQAIYIMLDGDVAQTLGHILRDELGVATELLVIDGVVLWDFDYIDLGRIRYPSNTVPVTIKSLVFSEDPRGPRPRQRLHHHDHDHDHAHDHQHDHAHGHHHHHHHD
ncbi:MAG TPA: ethanolamine ammonia-lyase reactivating factor EutA [Xanthobacteraceae bacterium]|nr:ethanolamine ammonia-lyase reactivating factor EutA [Xanthobacteraceae bacterium]